VTREGDRLLARLTGQQTFEVHPYGNPDIEMTAIREGDKLFVRVTGYSRYRVFP
jgi:hypothetical protein